MDYKVRFDARYKMRLSNSECNNVTNSNALQYRRIAMTTCIRSRTREPMTNGLALLAHWAVLSKTKPCQFSYVPL